MTAPSIIALFILQLGAADPDTLRLADAFASARAHFPPARQTELYAEITNRRIENVNARLRPQFSTSAQAVYHSEVPELPIEMPGSAPPEISNDQYKVAANVEQLIYDGGAVSAQRALERTSGELAAEEVAVSLHERLDRVSEAYFAVLLQDAAAARLELYRSNVIARRSAVEAHIDEGLLSASEADKLTVELLEIDQQIAEARAHRSAAAKVLRELSGLEPGGAAVLVRPELSPEIETIDASAAIEAIDPSSGFEAIDASSGFDAAALADPSSVIAARPEARVFELQRDRLARQARLASVKNRPRVSGFGSAAYGRPPGLNMFENELSPYYSVGIQVQWPILDWGAARREQEIAALQREIVDTQEEAFAEGIRAAAVQAREEIARLRAAVERDGEIIQLRNRIAGRAAEQLENGTISATDYLLEERAAREAQLEQDRHHIELGLAEVRLLGILGYYDEIR